MDVSIIIVSYNTKSLIKNCINSIYKYTKDISFEIIVSDNGSIDGSVEMIKRDFPSVILIENNENLGFGAANNKGFSLAKGKYILYLNSDTILLNNSVKFFYDYWEESSEKENLGALGSNLINENNKIIHSYGTFPNINKEIFTTLKVLINVTKFSFLKIIFNKNIPSCLEQNIHQYYVGEVDYITGSDLFLKNDSNAYFDEKFFMYCEETDLQYKLFQKKLKRVIIDGPKIIHLCGASSNFEKKTIDRVSYFKTFSSIQYYISRIKYFKNRKISLFKINILKCLTILIWINPLLIKKLKIYIKELN